MDYKIILKDLTSCSGVSGHEGSLALLIKDIFAKYCESVEIDAFYNVIGIKKGTGKNNKKIMITAHLDEIGLIVKSIDDNGFIKFTNIGGIDRKILLAQEVTIHGRKDVTGVIGAKPPHLLKAEETKKTVKLDDLAIDTGMIGEKLKKYVSIGDVITFKSNAFELQNSKFSSKSLDNRISIAAMLEVMRQLNDIKHKDDVYFVATAQEEFELTGATISAYNIRPDISIVIDACHGDMPDAPKDETYGLGKGPAIGLGPNLDRKLTQKIINVAKDYNIPYQIDVEPGDTGTEAWAIQVSRCGIPTILVSIPVRYMHTPIETSNLNDMKNAGRLIAKFIEILNETEAS